MVSEMEEGGGSRKVRGGETWRSEVVEKWRDGITGGMRGAGISGGGRELEE